MTYAELLYADACGPHSCFYRLWNPSGVLLATSWGLCSCEWCPVGLVTYSLYINDTGIPRTLYIECLNLSQWTACLLAAPVAAASCSQQMVEMVRL